MKKGEVIIALVVSALIVFILAEVFVLRNLNLLSSITKKSNLQTTNAEKNRGLNDQFITNEYLAKIKTAFQRVEKNKNLKLTLIFEQTGYAQVLIDKEVESPYYNSPYITLVDKDGKKLFSFGNNYYEHLYKMVGNTKSKITLKDVKTGDLIIDREYFDIYNSSGSAEVLIYEK